MKLLTAQSLIIIGLSLTLLGCEKESSTSCHAKILKIDGRYDREIIFDFIGVSIPIKNSNTFIRIDDPVLDMNKHQEELLNELYVSSTNIWYSNPAEGGRSMHLFFEDGKECTFIWVLKASDIRISQISIEHEKYHALCRIVPEGVVLLSEAIRKKGFDIELKDYDEELSATIVQIVSLHLLGIPLEEISGSNLVVQATEILKNNKSNQSIHSIAGSARSE